MLEPSLALKEMKSLKKSLMLNGTKGVAASEEPSQFILQPEKGKYQRNIVVVNNTETKQSLG